MLRIIFVFFYPPKVYVAFKITIGLKFNSDQYQTKRKKKNKLPSITPVKRRQIE